MHVAQAQSPATLDIIVVSGEEAHARVDKECLRRLGLPEPQLFSNGAEAAERLARKPADVVLLDDKLEDMDGLEFMRLVRMHPELRRRLPVVMASPGNTRGQVLEALEAGCAGYLIRPYSVQSLAGHLERAMKGTMRAFSASASALAFARGEEEPDEAEFQREVARRRGELDAARAELRALERGRVFLEAAQYAKAIAEFSRAAEQAAASGGSGDAYVGLAEAWRGQGHPNRYIHYMHMAVRAFTRSGEPNRAVRAALRLRERAPHAGDPCVNIARDYVKGGDFSQAAACFEIAALCNKRSARGAGENPRLFEEMKRVCHFAERPNRAAAMLAKELGRNGRFGRPRAVFRRIMGVTLAPAGPVLPGIEGVHAPRAPRDRKAALGDVWAVVKYTVKAYVGHDGHDEKGSRGALLDPLEEGA
ncbi:MAG: response regulator [Desulfovibrionaceae bacterium]|jgi:CheY-like chemotaxis protein|nr:response regulator [Desulfovibrionaceae bacterium]